MIDCPLELQRFEPPVPSSGGNVQVTTDNGGAIHECKPNGASNYPLRHGPCWLWLGTGYGKH
jgi:hypothetical protein